MSNGKDQFQQSLEALNEIESFESQIEQDRRHFFAQVKIVREHLEFLDSRRAVRIEAARMAAETRHGSANAEQRSANAEQRSANAKQRNAKGSKEVSKEVSKETKSKSPPGGAPDGAQTGQTVIAQWVDSFRAKGWPDPDLSGRETSAAKRLASKKPEDLAAAMAWYLNDQFETGTKGPSLSGLERVFTATLHKARVGAAGGNFPRSNGDNEPFTYDPSRVYTDAEYLASAEETKRR